MRPSTAVIAVVVVAAAGYGIYKLGGGASSTAREVSTIAVGIPQEASIAAAKANLAAGVAAAESYRTDHGGYTGMTTAGIDAYNSTLNVSVASADATSYCLQSVLGTAVVSVRGPNGAAVSGAC